MTNAPHVRDNRQHAASRHPVFLLCTNGGSGRWVHINSLQGHRSEAKVRAESDVGTLCTGRGRSMAARSARNSATRTGVRGGRPCAFIFSPEFTVKRIPRLLVVLVATNAQASWRRSYRVQEIVPHLWFDKEATEAAAFYTSLFKHSKVNSVSAITDTPSGDCDIVSFTLAGQDFMAISAGPVSSSSIRLFHSSRSSTTRPRSTPPGTNSS